MNGGDPFLKERVGGGRELDDKNMISTSKHQIESITINDQAKKIYPVHGGGMLRKSCITELNVLKKPNQDENSLVLITEAITLE